MRFGFGKTVDRQRDRNDAFRPRRNLIGAEVERDAVRGQQKGLKVFRFGFRAGVHHVRRQAPAEEFPPGLFAEKAQGRIRLAEEIGKCQVLKVDRQLDRIEEEELLKKWRDEE